MQIYGPSQLHSAQSINAPHNINRAPETSGVSRSSFAGGDELQLSEAGQLAAKMSDIPDIRADRVASLRAQIQAGTYDTSDKLDGALSRLLDEIG